MSTVDRYMTNERGREITYQVDVPSQHCAFRFQAKKFSVPRVLQECQRRGITGPVWVSWARMNRSGINTQIKEVTA